MTFQIRPAQPVDAPRIAHVQVESWKTTYAGIVPNSFLDALSKEGRTQRWQEQLEGQATLIFVAEDENGIFGFITGGPIREPFGKYDAELYAIYLLQSHQKRGTGRVLIQTLAIALHDLGSKSMVVWVLEANPAVEFYKHLGAIPITQKSIHIGGVDLPELALGWPRLQTLL